MSKQTPGDWEFIESEDNRSIVANGKTIMCDAAYYPWCPDNKYDWILMAAAPELLTALLEANDQFEAEGYNPDGPTRSMILAAIAKATGEKA